MGFRSPEWLWLGLLSVPLIILYILKVRRERQRVSSTLFWSEALREIEAQVPFRRLRRDWLLLLQLLILASLTLAAAGPYLRTMIPAGLSVAIVVDGSAGMLAADRLDEARVQVSRFVRSRGSGDRALLILAGVRPEVLAPLTEDRTELLAAVAELEARPVAADVEAAVRLARSILGPEGKVVLITAAADPDPPLEDVRIVAVGEPLDNVGIVAMGLRRSDPSGFDQEVFVRLKNASASVVEGTVELIVDGKVRDASAVSLETEAEVGRTLRLVGVGEGLVEARWRSSAEDGLDADDRAFWILRRPRPRGYRVIGESNAFMDRALSALDGWRAAPPGSPADLEIVVRRSPEPEGPPFLWIDPLELRESVVQGAGVLSWDRHHPVLRSANLNAVRMGATARVRRPPGARVLAESSAGPFVMTGSRESRRYVVWAFEPLNSNLPLSVSFPLMVHNAVEFLAPRDARLPEGLATGDAPEVPWPSSSTARLIAPSGRETELVARAGMIRLPPVDETGVWRLFDDERSLEFGASLQDVGQVDLRRTSAASVEAGKAGAADGVARVESGLRDLLPLLALVGLGLLLLEGLAFHRRWNP